MLKRKAAHYYFAKKQYARAAQYAIEAQDYGLLEKIILACYRDYLKAGNYSENGIYEYFRLRKAYDPVLEFAYDHGIEPEITRQMMEFAGYKAKKVYIETLGPFTVYQDKDKQKPLKFRTKKGRELLAFLLDAGDQGATKEQIYNAIWRESDSDNIKNLIAVNLAQPPKESNIRKFMRKP